MLGVWRSNRVERLVDALADRLREPVGDPFALETVVVPSRGMESWLSARLAERLTVCAG
ncbi:MAG: exodeoxyribonuclease V subunit gamma, partial [Planctomycetota bacterium JB042]